MFAQLLPLILSQTALISLEQPVPTDIGTGPRIIALRADRIAGTPSASEAQIDELSIRISSPAGELWQGNVRVAQNQGASYSQNFSQASPTACSGNSYDRSERSSINFNVYLQNNGYGMTYRFDASWQRPSEDSGCGERGTRTVSVTKALALKPSETGVVEGDAGLRVEITRRR
jgi:hypothetical protein